MKFIQYNLAGEIIKECSIVFDQLKVNPLGEKVRITTNDGKEYTGFWNIPIVQQNNKTVLVSQYDLDEATSKLRSSNDISIFIPAQNIAKIEAILHSNPRWGQQPTNRFTFPKPIDPK